MWKHQSNNIDIYMCGGWCDVPALAVVCVSGNVGIETPAILEDLRTRLYNTPGTRSSARYDVTLLGMV